MQRILAKRFGPQESTGEMDGSDRTDFTWTQVSAVLLFLIGT